MYKQYSVNMFLYYPRILPTMISGVFLEPISPPPFWQDPNVLDINDSHRYSLDEYVPSSVTFFCVRDVSENCGYGTPRQEGIEWQSDEYGSAVLRRYNTPGVAEHHWLSCGWLTIYLRARVWLLQSCSLINLWCTNTSPATMNSFFPFISNHL